MIWDLLRVAIALVGAVLLYVVAASVVRNFANADPPPQDPDPSTLADVDFRYRCIVCGAQMVLYAAPEGDVPESPRHCREPMVLITPTGDEPDSDAEGR